MKFDLLTGNFFDLQKDFLDKALNHSIYNNYVQKNISKDERELTRKLFNYISMAKLYIDQVPVILKDVDNSISDQIKTMIKYKREKQIKENFNFRLMIALRNHIQHFDFPTGIYEGADIVNIKIGNAINFHHTGINLNIKKFMLNNSMTKQFPEGFALKEEEIDLTEIILLFHREICIIHNQIREQIKVIQKKATDFIESVFNHFSKETGYIFDSFQQILVISDDSLVDDISGNSRYYIFTKNPIRLASELQLQNDCKKNVLYNVVTNVTKLQMKPIKDNCNLLLRKKK